MADKKPTYRAPLALIETRTASFGFDAWQEAITAACDVVSEALGQIVRPQVWEVAVPAVDGALTLPKWPVIDVLRVRYFDGAGNEHDMAPTDFYRTFDGLKTIMRPKARRAWPSGVDRPDAITVTFLAGYTELPPNVRAMIGARLK